MNYERGKMSIFPLAMNTADKYDVVFIGDVVPNYRNSHLPNLFNNDYVFLFTTMLNQDKDSYWYGHVNIDLVRHDQLSYFNHHLRERGDFHVLGDESLILNDFLELVPEKTEKGIQIIAHLKKQNILGKDYRTVKMVKNFQVLLLSENKGKRYDNYPILELGPEFQAEIEFAEATQRCYDLNDSTLILKGVADRNKRNPEVINAVEVVQEALNKDINDAEVKKDQAFERYLEYKRRLSYIHKSTGF